MKIALLGYGKMGKEVEKAAIERKHKIELIIDINNPKDLTKENLEKVDVAIDFTLPDVAFNNIMVCFDANIPVVSGTTGWLDRWDEITKICTEKNQTFFYASNFSIGVNILFHLNKKLAQLMNSMNNYNVSIEEIHHIHKLDAPSGTAITLANEILADVDRKTKWELNTESDPQTLRINAVREDEVPGTHIVTYDSDIDYIEIKHVARNRKGFAMGAVIAAEYIKGKKGIYTMEKLLNF